MQAQPQQPKRLEIELGVTENPFKVQSLEEGGLILYRQVNQVRLEQETPYEFVRYDTALEETWRMTYRLDRRYNLVGLDVHQDSIYFLYDQVGPTEPYLLLKMGLQQGDTTMQSVRKVVSLQLSAFESVGNSLVFGGYVNGRAAILLYNRDDGKQRVLPNFYDEQSELMELKINDRDSTFDVSVLKKEPRKPYTLVLRTFDATGLLLREQEMSLPDGLSIVFGRSANQAAGPKVVVGTYSDKRSDYTKGVFVGNLSEDGEATYFTYAYEDLENFFNYLKGKRRERVLERIRRRRVQGKKARFAYRLQVHDVVEMDGYFIMVGEAFYPVYRYYGSGGPGGIADRTNSTFFDGYRFTHSVVMAFTPDGEVLWNNSFEIEGIQSMVLNEFVKVHVNRERVVLLYLFEGEIRSKVIRGDTMEEGKFFDPIALKFGAEMVQRNDNEMNSLERWYDDFFYAAGVQEIRSLRERRFDKRRRVFYVNKIVYP